MLASALAVSLVSRDLGIYGVSWFAGSARYVLGCKVLVEKLREEIFSCIVNREMQSSPCRKSLAV